MNQDSMLERMEKAQQERQQSQQEEIRKILATLKSDLQSSLLAESQSFKNSIAAAQSRFNRLQRLALVTVTLASLFSLLLMLASVWEAHRITSQAETHLLFLQQQIAAIQDPFAELRKAKLTPTGQPVTTQGRIFIELKKMD